MCCFYDPVLSASCATRTRDNNKWLRLMCLNVCEHFIGCWVAPSGKLFSPLLWNETMRWKQYMCYNLIRLPTSITDLALCSHLMISPCSAESQALSVHHTYQNRVTALLPGDSYWTIIVSEIPSRCLNKPSNRAIILKQKVTSGVTTGPEINKAPNYDRSTRPIFGLQPPAIQEKIRFQGHLIPSVRLWD